MFRSEPKYINEAIQSDMTEPDHWMEKIKTIVNSLGDGHNIYVRPGIIRHYGPDEVQAKIPRHPFPMPYILMD